MTKGTFGDHLKREREMRGVSLDEISTATRMARRVLTAIEDEQWDQLPGGVFNRGFVRAMARYLGLDEENIVAEYASAAGDRPSVPVWTGSPPAVTPDLPWLAWILAAVVAFGLATGGWFAVRRIFVWRASRHATQIASASAMPSPAPPAQPGRVSAGPASTPPPISPKSPGGADIPVVPAAGPISLPAAAPFELKVEAGKPTHVTVEADSRHVFEGTMKAGEHRIFTAQDKILVSARDAGALLLELNGKALAPIGPPGREGKATLTRESLKRTA